MHDSYDIAPGGRLAYSPREAATVTGLSDRSIRYLLSTGRLGHVRIGRRILIRASDLEALLRRHAVRAITPMDADAPIRPNAGSDASEGLSHDA